MTPDRSSTAQPPPVPRRTAGGSKAKPHELASGRAFRSHWVTPAMAHQSASARTSLPTCVHYPPHYRLFMLVFRKSVVKRKPSREFTKTGDTVTIRSVGAEQWPCTPGGRRSFVN